MLDILGDSFVFQIVIQDDNLKIFFFDVFVREFNIIANVIFLVLNNTANVISSFHAHVKVGTLCDDETFHGCRLPFVIVPLPQRHNESYHCFRILAL